MKVKLYSGGKFETISSNLWIKLQQKILFDGFTDTFVPIIKKKKLQLMEWLFWEITLLILCYCMEYEYNWHMYTVYSIIQIIIIYNS